MGTVSHAVHATAIDLLDRFAASLVETHGTTREAAETCKKYVYAWVRAFPNTAPAELGPRHLDRYAEWCKSQAVAEHSLQELRIAGARFIEFVTASSEGAGSRETSDPEHDDHLQLLPPELLRRRDYLAAHGAPECVSSESARAEPRATPAITRGVRHHVEAAPVPSAAELFARITSSQGLIMVAALTMPLVLGFLPMLSLLCLLAHLAGIATECFNTVLHVGRHRPGLPLVLAELGDGTGMLARAIQGVACAAPVCFPIIMWYRAASSGGAALGSTMPELVLIFVTAMLVPASAMAVVVSKSCLSAINPLSWARIMRGIGRSYLRHASATAGLITLAIILRWHPWAEFGMLFHIVRIYLSTAVLLGAAVVIGRALLIHHELFELALVRPIAGPEPAANEPH